MQINHRVTSLVFAFSLGLLVSFCSYQWITDPDRRTQRAIEEGVVLQSRQVLEQYVGSKGGIEISDPLNRVREAGKVYIYPVESGWELSGQYRRVGERRWHAYLMNLDGDARLISLAVEDDDPALQEKARSDSRFSTSASR